jgi:hypothetical protein
MESFYESGEEGSVHSDASGLMDDLGAGEQHGEDRSGYVLVSRATAHTTGEGDMRGGGVGGSVCVSVCVLCCGSRSASCVVVCVVCGGGEGAGGGVVEGGGRV